MDAGSWIQLLSTIGMAIATGVVAWATVRLESATKEYVGAAQEQVKVTAETLQEMRAQREPYVYLKFEDPGRGFEFVIGNSGQSAALNVRLDVMREAPWWKRVTGGTHVEAVDLLAGMPIFQSGLSRIEPGEKLRYDCGGRPNNQRLDDQNSRVSISVAYTNESGRKFSRQVDIDVRAFMGLLFKSFEGGTRDQIASELKDIRRLLSKRMPKPDYDSMRDQREPSAGTSPDTP